MLIYIIYVIITAIACLITYHTIYVLVIDNNNNQLEDVRNNVINLHAQHTVHMTIMHVKIPAD